MPYGAQPPAPYAPQGNYAGFWIRVVAYVIDALLLGAVATIVNLILHANPSDPQSSGSAAARVSIHRMALASGSPAPSTGRTVTAVEATLQPITSA